MGARKPFLRTNFGQTSAAAVAVAKLGTTSRGGLSVQSWRVSEGRGPRGRPAARVWLGFGSRSAILPAPPWWGFGIGSTKHTPGPSLGHRRTHANHHKPSPFSLFVVTSTRAVVAYHRRDLQGEWLCSVCSVQGSVAHLTFRQMQGNSVRDGRGCRYCMPDSDADPPTRQAAQRPEIDDLYIAGAASCLQLRCARQLIETRPDSSRLHETCCRAQQTQEPCKAELPRGVPPYRLWRLNSSECE
ncbi:hypothetical protein CCHR01_11151 [Colletotrichum chrysophilum]|uniref:Uncharacterized protein n=1 Tax=Colletotrichum chrysophilum TaxID=1836956 RepID=A0AAD9AF59_9PEZI|nr:hypothetical protein CCHR01_11151 [Colletotrichum chrysophilum]